MSQTNKKSPANKTKVAILGGGVGAITSAFELTSTPELRSKYDVTIYQLGWRLGGKGASGRSQVGKAERIEEHGLHILMGCYENSFRMLRECYKELGRADSTPLQTVDDAFKPQSLVVAEQFFNKQWYRWSINFPEDKHLDGAVKMPGNRHSLPGVLTYLKRLVQWMESWLLHVTSAAKEAPTGLSGAAVHAHGKDVCSQLHAHIKTLESGTDNAEKVGFSPHGLEKLRLHCRELMVDIDEIEADLLRVFMLLDLSLTCVIGIFKYNLFFNTYDTINHFDFREWLLDCGASQMTVDSPIVTILYELVFAYENGRSVPDSTGPVIPNMEAGTIMRALPHMMLGYTGAFMWKMQSAMGDTIFAPMYQVLKNRGVKFRFFNKVTNLGVNGNEIVSVDVVQQVNLKNDKYDPLIDVNVKGYNHPLPAWPAEPLYDQIVEGDRIRDDKINLESFYTPWKDACEPVTLKVGVDFDLVILGISIGSYPYICSELIDSNDDWKQMVRNVKTVQTQAAQFWMKPSFSELGFPEQGSVVGNLFTSALDTAADMSYLINDEGWPDGSVNALVYFTGPMEGPEVAPPPQTTGFVEKSKAHNQSVVDSLLNNQINVLFPEYQGEQQIVSRYQRVNISPSERYVMSVKNSSKHRLKADDTKFKNLLMAGDWTECRINMGCVEAAAISGMQASQAICGHPKQILLYPNKVL